MLTDDEFSDLESRLALALAGRLTWTQADRQDARALLEEVRTMRPFVPAALAALEQVSWVLDSLDGLRAEQGGDERLVRKLRGHLWRTRGAVLAALECRPAGGDASHEGGDRVLERVMAERAELERLRRPPDVAGLLPAEDLGRLRDTLGAPVSKSILLRVHDALALLAHIDAQAAHMREQYGLISDLLAHGDGPGVPAYERGRAEGREGAARAVGEILLDLLVCGRRADGRTATVLRHVAAKITALGPCRPPLPPCAEAAEARRLRKALREIVALPAVRQDESHEIAACALGEGDGA